MRLDRAVTDRGFARSRSQASELIRVGRVRLDGRVVLKPAAEVAVDSLVEVEIDPYVSRAAHKLLGALEETGIQIPERVLDAGASTGGFTQVLLNAGAKRVYSVDVGHGQLAASLREDARVANLEGLHLKDLTLDHLDGELVDLIVADVSFISLTMLLPHLLPLMSSDGQALILVKPQFEVGRERLGAGGIVTDPELHAWSVDRVATVARELGWVELWRGVSQLPGPGGNLEFFLQLAFSGRPKPNND